MRKGLGFFIVRLGGQLEWFMDVLSSVLHELWFESASCRRHDLRAPWRLRFDGGLRGVTSWCRGAAASLWTVNNRALLSFGTWAQIGPNDFGKARWRGGQGAHLGGAGGGLVQSGRAQPAARD
jgi:hypothetical protein